MFRILETVEVETKIQEEEECLDCWKHYRWKQKTGSRGMFRLLETVVVETERHGQKDA